MKGTVIFNPERSLRWLGGLLLLFIITCQNANALSVIDSTVLGRDVYVIDWKDNDGKLRKFCLVKAADQDYVGTAQLIRYYDGNTAVNITSIYPNSGALNSGFGSTTHHVDPTPNQHRATSGHTLTKVFQGDHIAIFDWTQTIGGAVETITYTFMDGLDYFQWQNTTNATAGTLNGDSRGPYCTMQWDGVDFSEIDGCEYAAQKYFVQPDYNGPWTFSGTVDIPYVLEWDNNREVGYVQTQTYTQQMAGNPTWGGSLNLAASGSSIVDNDIWMFDYQMNFYDKAKKITWGLPYGYMRGDAAAGAKSGWGQYSLSIIFDAMSEAGVKRVRDENRVIHNGNVALTAIDGSVVTTGPVGTANPATQTLSPAGFDHNYRTWWIQADGTGEAEVSIAVSSGSLKNPTFRVKAMSALPGIVQYNGSTLVLNTDYYASYNSSTNEVWLTLLRNVTGTNTLRIVDSNLSGISITAGSVTPSSVFNNVSNNLTFSLTATDDGSIASVTVDLSSIGGGAAVAMTPAGGNNYTLPYTMSAGVPAGNKTIVAIVTDNLGNTKTKNITMTVSASMTYLNIYTDAETQITGTWNSNGTLAEQTGGGAIEGTKDYHFGFTAVGYYAGFGLNLSSWDPLQARDYSTYENLEISYQGPATAGTGINITFIGPSSAQSATYNLPLSGSYTSLTIPLTAFAPFDFSKVTEIDMSVAGTQTGTGSFRIDNMRLSKQNVPPTPEINVKVGSTSVASGGSYDFGTITSGTSGTGIVFTIENTGMIDLNLSGSPIVSISGTNASEFTITQTTTASVVSSMSSTGFSVTFSPTSPGAKSATISIANDDAGENPYVINFTGTSSATPVSDINLQIASVNKASGSSYNFTSVDAGASGTPVSFTVQNLAAADLILTGTPKVAISGADASSFSIVQTFLAGTIASSGSSAFTIAFTPSTAGAKSATITITNNDPDEASYTISLTGTATVPTSVTESFKGSMEIYPNPASKAVDISIGDITGNMKISLRNQYGMIVKETQTMQVSGSADYHLELGELPSGIYYLELSSSQGNAVRKIFKQ